MDDPAFGRVPRRHMLEGKLVRSSGSNSAKVPCRRCFLQGEECVRVLRDTLPYRNNAKHTGSGFVPKPPAGMRALRSVLMLCPRNPFYHLFQLTRVRGLHDVPIGDPAGKILFELAVR